MTVYHDIVGDGGSEDPRADADPEDVRVVQVLQTFGSLTLLTPEFNVRYPRELANHDVDEAIAHYLSEGAQQFAVTVPLSGAPTRHSDLARYLAA